MTEDASKSGPPPRANREGTSSQSDSYSDRAYTWLSRNGLYIEAGISIVAVALGGLALPFLAFGSLAAIGGEESILAGGVAIALVSIILLIGLATLLLIHGYLEVSRHRHLFAGDCRTHTIAYEGIRTIETGAAATFIGGLLAAVGFTVLIGELPTALSVVVAVAAVGLPVAVLIHATGRFGSFVLDAA